MSGKGEGEISSVELGSTICIFLIASAMLVPIGALAENKVWISIIIAIVLGLGYTWIYVGLCDSHPGKSIVEISELLIGKWAGKIIGLIYVLFGFQIASLVMRDLVQVTLAVALPSTPITVIAGTTIILVVWMAYAGIEAIGRVSIVFTPIVIFYAVITFILLIKDMDLRNLLPVFDNKWREVLYSALQITALPFGEIILFTMVFPSISKRGNIKTSSLLGIVVSGILILIVNLMDVLVLGNLRPKLTYPTYTVFSYVQIADFFDRAEIMVYTMFLVLNIIKISVCVYAAAVSLSKTLNTRDYRVFLIPLGLLVAELSTFIEYSQAHLISWITYVAPWYTIPIQFLIPLLLLVLTVINKRLKHSV